MKRTFTRLFLSFFAIVVLAVPAFAASAVSASVPVRSGPTHPSKAAIDSAMAEFNSLSRRERKMRIKASKKYLKEYRAEKRSGKSASETDQTLLIILCILLPPLAVYLKEDDIDTKFWISILLTLLFWLPGIIYALLVVFDEI